MYIGPNSAISYDSLSNVQTINYLQGVTLSNQYIYADGTYLSNLPTSGGITQSNLNSTLTGLGSIGYISSSQLTSTVNGLGIGMNQNVINSTIIGLGTFGYISSATLQSTISGLGASVLPSTITGLGTFGYISSTQLTSTTRGLGNIYLSTNIVPSTIVGLGTFGYISSSQLTSTVRGLGQIYVSTNIVPSTIVGLGSIGYISSSQLTSTVRGLGQIYLSTSGGGTPTTWANYPALGNVNMNSNQISNIQLNYSNTFSNTSVVPTLIAASPQTFSGAIFDQGIPSGAFTTIITTNSESNYLYFERNQSIWKIHITMNGIGSFLGPIAVYFTLSNCTSGIEQLCTLYTNSNNFLITPVFTNNVTISLNDTVNLSDIINSSINPYTPISLNMYAAAGDGGYHFTSSYLGSWVHPIILSDLNVGYGVAYGNNTWIVVGVSLAMSNGYMITSYDNGKTWVGTDLSSFGGICNCVAYGNGIWVIGTSVGLLYSTDGTNFVYADVQPINNVTSIAYGNGVFVAIGDGAYYKAYSTNGNIWTHVPTNLPATNRYGVAYGNGIFVVVGADVTGGLLTSQDGINWIQQTVATDLKCVAYGNGRWYAGDGAGNLYYSTDNWYSNTLITTTPSFISITLGDSFVGVDAGGTIYNSSDFGVTWTTTNNFPNAGYGIAYGNGVYVACGDTDNTADSRSVYITNATNLLSYTLEPATIQPQTYVLAAPTIDWSNTNYNFTNLVISWFSVTGATYYKVFLQINDPTYLNKYTTKASTTFDYALSGNMFLTASANIYTTSYTIAASSSIIFNYYVFAYRDGVRSSFPSTRVYDSNATLQLWPVQQLEYIGGNNYASFVNVTARNLYTNKSYIMSSSDWVTRDPTNSGTVRISEISTNVYLSNK